MAGPAPYPPTPLPPRRRLPLSDRALRRFRAPNYSRFVSLMKVALPSAAALLLGLVVLWPQLSFRDERFTLGFSQLDPKRVDTLSMNNPRFFGVDQSNQPFTVTATTATQADRTQMVVALEAPKADMTTKGGEGVLMDAELGFYREQDHTIDLMGGVSLFHERGYQMHTPSARINLADGSAIGDEPAQAQGPVGNIEGEGFQLLDRGKTITFTGKAKAVLVTSPANKGKRT